MKKLIFKSVVAMLLIVILPSLGYSQKYKFPYQNPELDVATRAEDLLSRLTLEEKAMQMQDVSPAIERLELPEYNWWNECLHGVARAGRATSFPQAIGMAATWNSSLINQAADAISTEARAKFNASINKGQRKRYQGLSMWTPNINIFRDPRWGRGQETYGEDPLLTSKMGVAFITGLQGDDSEYLKVVATPKHFAVHSGPEHNRHSFDAYTTPKDLWETYLPAFEAAVVEGRAHSVMSAYNRYLGESATASKLLLTDILRDEWNFDGYVVSDCGAVSDIYRFHKITDSAETASALSVKAGCDLNCGDSFQHLPKAVEMGLITEDEIDVSLKRLLIARLKLGLLNPIDKMPYYNLDDSYIESETNAELALQTARESIVLLKNENRTLPLSKEIKSIAVIGPNANDRHFILGNYFGVPTNRTTILEGIKGKVSDNCTVNYFKGVNLTDNKPVFDVIPSSNFQDGVKIEYFNNSNFEGDVAYTEQESIIDFEWGGAAPIDILKPGKFSIRYSGVINATEDMELSLAVLESGGSYKLYIDNEEVVAGTSTTDFELKPKAVKFKKGNSYQVRLDYSCTNEWMASIQLLWNMDSQKGEKYMMDIVKNSDAVVYVGGITARLEGEEMPVKVDGFYKGDRTNLKLPAAQQQLIKKLNSCGKPVIFVLTTGSAIACNWEQENLPAIINAWYPGQAGGEAVADVLFGDYNPSGKLPVTFYKSVDDLPDFEDYSMKGRTYRYFDGEVLYPFGHGLSYTNFTISKPKLQDKKLSKSESTTASVTVKNRGKVDGDIVVQIYVKSLTAGEDVPLKSLIGFKKISIKEGESEVVTFDITPSDLSIFDEFGNKNQISGEFELFIGESSATTNGVELVVE